MPKSKRIYVASAFEQRDEVRNLYALLEAKGHKITADWTDHKEIGLLPSKVEQENLARQYAIEDTQGVLALMF